MQSTVACVLYHRDRLHSIESQVIEAIERFNYRAVLGNSTMALGDTKVWDFEYQAFVLAYRRCLDYLARAVSAYFRNDFHSFRRLSGFLKNAKPETVADALIPVLHQYTTEFQFVLSEGDRKSLRDKISHYEYVQAGTLNLSQRGFVFAGGGEDLSGFEGTLLSDVLDRRVAKLRECVRDVMYTLVDSVRAAEASNV